MATDDLMGAMHPVFIGVNDTLRFDNAEADCRLQHILADVVGGRSPGHQLISATTQRGDYIAHVIPINGKSRNFFYRAGAMLVFTGIGTTAMVPNVDIIADVYKLTSAEAKLARVLAMGHNLQQGAALMGVSYGTVRSYLLRVFQKTHTSQQSELVSLIKSLGQLNGALN